MKTILTLLLAVLVWSIGMAQPYVPFIREGAHWQQSVSYCSMGCDPGNPNQGTTLWSYERLYYKLEGDTLVGSTTLKKLYLATGSGYSQYYNGQFLGSSYSCGLYKLYRLLREDTTARKVYAGPEAFTTFFCSRIDSVFLDFSLQIGDSTYMSYTNSGNFTTCDTAYFVVDSINYSGFGADAVKTWYFHNAKHRTGWNGVSGGDLKLFEGIGYATGLDIGYGLGDGAWYLSRLDSFCVGSDSTCWPTCRTVGLNDISETPVSLTLSPDPAYNKVTVMLTPAMSHTIEIVSITGQSMGSSKSDEIDVAFLAPGMYIALVHTDKATIPKRFLKY